MKERKRRWPLTWLSPKQVKNEPKLLEDEKADACNDCSKRNKKVKRKQKAAR